MHYKKQIISFSDCDFAGVLFYGKIFDLAHRIFEDYLYEFHYYPNYFKDKDRIYPIVHCEASYLKVLTAGDEVTFNLKAKTIRESSFELEFEIYQDETELAAIVSTVHVAISTASKNKTELPEKLRDLLENLKKQ